METKDGYLLDDTTINKFVISPVCYLCKHYTPKKPGPDPNICDAFPEVIPDKIWSGENNHKKPYPCDNGIQFEAREEQ